MDRTVKAIFVAAVAQVCILSMLIGYMFVRTDDMALRYSQLAERNSAQLVRDQYNNIQVQFSQEREDLRKWVDQRIDLKLQQALKESRK
jgi:hypothetical protein